MAAVNKTLDTSNEGRFKPPPDFLEDERNSLIESALSDKSELWLIQWPKDQLPDFDGQELSLKLNNDGLLGNFEGSSGKSYDVISYSALAPEANVFTSSKIAGKISRRVSFVHYPDPSEIQKPVNSSLKQLYQRSSGTGTSRTHSSHTFATPTRSSHKSKSSKSTSSKGGSAYIGRNLNSVSEAGETPKLGKRKHNEEHSRQQSSGKSSGSLQHSSEKKSKKKQKV
ncbi:mediator-associated protein 2-like [Impatiens glandulifera]|uniref:mediator-associated protein 2-like n=1 Tax=Impatiens glandulifera TaxID=253017 RepID=UPI001FB0D264|nr:mediator-associated protein 2-like [Impatiens glandulifera]